jgi:uncharacterized metal-binding protein YceD (DUF177 family)
MSPEFSRTVRIDTLGGGPRAIEIGANQDERAALARRFGLVSVERLSAEASLVRRGDEVFATGRLSAAVVQSCVATEEPVPAVIDEPFEIRFRPHPEGGGGEEEIELGEGELDVIFYDGALIDVGEAAAETLALSLDPYPRSPAAEQALREAGVKSEEEAKPAGALAGLKDLLGKR